MLTRNSGSFRATRVHHYQLAACHQRLQALLEARGRHQAAVRSHGVGAEHQQVIGVVDVRNGNEELMPIHGPCHQLVRPLVHGRRREYIARFELAQQRRQIREVPEMMHVRVAEVGRERIGAMRTLHRGQPRARLRKGRLPGNLFPGISAPAQGAAQAVRVVFQVQNGIALGANMTTAERVRGVASNSLEFAAGVAKFQPANGLAERAGTETTGFRQSGHGGLPADTPKPTPRGLRRIAALFSASIAVNSGPPGAGSPLNPYRSASNSSSKASTMTGMSSATASP